MLFSYSAVTRRTFSFRPVAWTKKAATNPARMHKWKTNTRRMIRDDWLTVNLLSKFDVIQLNRFYNHTTHVAEGQ